MRSRRLCKFNQCFFVLSFSSKTALHCHLRSNMTSPAHLHRWLKLSDKSLIITRNFIWHLSFVVTHFVSSTYTLILERNILFPNEFSARLTFKIILAVKHFIWNKSCYKKNKALYVHSMFLHISLLELNSLPLQLPLLKLGNPSDYKA